MPRHRLIKAHQHDPRRLADVDLPDLRLLKIICDPEARRVEDATVVEPAVAYNDRRQPHTFQ